MEEPPVITPGTSIAKPKAIFMMADYGHDPTETAVPYTNFKKAEYDVHFVTEVGEAPRCDKKMLRGVTQKLLGAKKDVVAMYERMSQSPEWREPLSWSSPGFTLAPFDLVILPGGHEKSVRQIIDSPIVHGLLLDYFPLTRKPGKKAIGAVCHGVMVLSQTKDSNGYSVIRECLTTSLTSRFEQLAYWGTRPLLGDYYKTYGAGSENVEESVRKVLGHPAQFKSSLNPGPFICEDEKYNYISARYPGDAQLFSEELIKLMESFNKIQ